MQPLNRRNWLKKAGMTGALSVLGGLKAFSETRTDWEIANSTPIVNDEVIRLSSNENPLGPSKAVREAIINAFDQYCRYPFGYLNALTEMIAEAHGLTKDHVVITGGSTEGLKCAGLTYGLAGGEVVAATPTFLSLMRYAEQFGAHIHNVPLTKDLVHDLPAMEQRITQKTSLVYICNPNNPTGTILGGQELLDFTSAVEDRSMVFVDEAYFDYIEEPDYPSADQLVKKGENVIVARTFSKVYGLAGMRIGYLLARPDIALRMRQNIMAMTNVPAIMAAKSAMEDKAFYQESLRQNKAGKEMIYATLDDLGLAYIKSHTNFVFFKSGREIQQLIDQMLKHHVRIGRPFPPLTKWCRISTGTLPQTEAFTTALKKVMA